MFLYVLELDTFNQAFTNLAFTFNQALSDIVEMAVKIFRACSISFNFRFLSGSLFFRVDNDVADGYNVLLE